MRLADLNPQWAKGYKNHDKTPDRGGVPDGTYYLTFDCPSCGKPYQIIVRLGEVADLATRTWQASPLPDGMDWPNRVTITPSIDNTVTNHGRKGPKHCGFHGNIFNGEVNALPHPTQGATP